MADMVHSPAAWLELLAKRLDDRWVTRLFTYDAYFEGDHNLGFATVRMREAFGNLLGSIPDNWMPLVVESKVERLKVQGFRFGKNTGADEAAWEIWQENDLDAESDMAHTEAAKLEEAYWLVQPMGGDNAPLVTVEHPQECIVACDPANRRRRLAGLKKWRGEDGYMYANVYLPTMVAKYKSQVEVVTNTWSGDWRPVETVRHDLGEVPLIPIRNAPKMMGPGVSDLKVAIPIQDALNKLLSDMLIGSEYQAYPQRVALGVEPPKNQQTGQPDRAAALQASQSQIWFLPEPEAKIAEFSAADLNNYVDARKHLIDGLTAKTRTPPHYVAGQIVNASGDALKAAETGLVAKTRKAMPSFEASHEDMMRLAFRAMGDTTRADVKDAEVIWRDPESRSQAELVDALVKLKGLNIPDEILWERAGFSPTEIQRIKTLQATDDLLGAAVEPDPVEEPPEVPAAPSNGNGEVSPARQEMLRAQPGRARARGQPSTAA